MKTTTLVATISYATPVSGQRSRAEDISVARSLTVAALAYFVVIFAASRSRIAWSAGFRERGRHGALEDYSLEPRTGDRERRCPSGGHRALRIFVICALAGFSLGLVRRRRGCRGIVGALGGGGVRRVLANTPVMVKILGSTFALRSSSGRDQPLAAAALGMR